MEMCKFDTQIYTLHLKFMHMPFVRLPGKMESISALSLCGESYLLELSTEVHSQQEFQLRLLLKQLLLVHNFSICIFDARKHLLPVTWNMLEHKDLYWNRVNIFSIYHEIASGFAI